MKVYIVTIQFLDPREPSVIGAYSSEKLARAAFNKQFAGFASLPMARIIRVDLDNVSDVDKIYESFGVPLPPLRILQMTANKIVLVGGLCMGCALIAARHGTYLIAGINAGVAVWCMFMARRYQK